MTRTLALAGALLVAAGAARLAGGVPTARAAEAAPQPDFTSAQSDYVEHCGGCHGLEGDSAPANIPVLRGRVGYFMCLDEGRTYLMQLPNVAFSSTDNAELADLMNFVVFSLGGASTPRNARPFTEADVARLRPHPMTGVSLVETRRALVKKLQARCGAPASLQSMYPHAAGGGAKSGD